MQNDTRIAVDLAKAVFEVAVSERPGRISRRERLPRARFLNFFAQRRSATKQLPVVAQLLTIPGVGLLTATAMLAFIGDIRRFPSARHFASYLGLTPREYSSGLTRRLGHISKRGDGYLRTLLIHGARSVLLHARTSQTDRLRACANKLAQTHVHNKVAVAVANTLARIVWATRYGPGSTHPIAKRPEIRLQSDPFYRREQLTLASLT